MANLFDLPEELLIQIYTHNAANISDKSSYQKYLNTLVSRSLVIPWKTALQDSKPPTLKLEIWVKKPSSELHRLKGSKSDYTVDVRIAGFGMVDDAGKLVGRMFAPAVKSIEVCLNPTGEEAVGEAMRQLKVLLVGFEKLTSLVVDGNEVMEKHEEEVQRALEESGKGFRLITAEERREALVRRFQDLLRSNSSDESGDEDGED